MWGWYLDSTTDCLWHLEGHQWSCHSQIPSNSRMKPFHKMVVTNENGPPPQQLQCIKFIAIGQKLVLSVVGSMHTPCLEVTVGLDTLLALPIVKEWNLKLWVQGKLSNLQTELIIGNGFAVSNGSFSGSGIAAWIIKGRNSKHHLAGVWMTTRYQSRSQCILQQALGNLWHTPYLVIFASNTTHPTF